MERRGGVSVNKEVEWRQWYGGLFKLTPPCVPLYYCLHSTSLFKTYPPLRSTIPLSPFYFFIYTYPPPAFHYTIFSFLLLYLKLTPPCVPLNHCHHSTSFFKLTPSPCVPLYYCLHSTSLFKLTPPCVPLYHFSPFYFCI